MATAITLISSVTVGSGGAATIDFTSIPSTYTDLAIKISGRDSATPASFNSITMAFNNSATNQINRILEGTGSAAISGSSSTLYAGANMSQGSASNLFSSIDIYIPNYAGSNNKSYSSDSVTEQNATTAFADLVAGLWSNTSAINRITFTPANGYSFSQYSTAYLYGISNA